MSNNTLVQISDLFDIEYGNSFSLNELNQTQKGINFISRTQKNNGVAAIVEAYQNIPPFPKGLMTVALGGSVLETFVQPAPFYTGYHIYCLTPKIKEKYRYNYGRKWGIARMKNSKIKLPVDNNGNPNWEFMENYIKSLSFSNKI